MSSYRTPLNIIIDADGSPSGYVAWYNHSIETGKIRVLRPTIKNDRYGVQRMEMLAVYFAISDNLFNISRIANIQKKKQLVINIRSDSKTTVDQLKGTSEVRDAVLQRICIAIKNLLMKMTYAIIFNHLQRTRNVAGFLLEQRRRKEEERVLMNRYEKYYGIGRLQMFTTISRLQSLITA